MNMERQLIVLGAALAALYLVGKTDIVRSIRVGGAMTEIADNVFAIKDNFGQFLRCEDAEGNILPSARCGGPRCGFGGCPDDDGPEEG
jgi:Na+-translocating ferredoxin:NAD+ oxidoreductase RNF subunit RnfB